MPYSYSQEGEALKSKFKEMYDAWSQQFYSTTGDKPAQTSSNPQGKGITKGAAKRGFKSFMLSPDEVHLDYVDNRLSKGASVKSIMGGLRGRVQKTSQGKLSPYGVTPTDELHHMLPFGSYGTVINQNGSVRLDFFQRAEDEGLLFGDSRGNLKGHSLDPRAHTGGRGGAAKGTAVKAGYGLEGETALSGHPRGTTDPLVVPDKLYTSGRELFDAAKPVIETNRADVKIGLAADQPRREFLQKVLVSQGVVPDGVDIFGKDVDDASVAKAKKFLSGREDIMIGAAKAFDPKEAKALIKKLSAASLIGVGALGTAADAAETGLRTKVAAESKNPVDALQAAISAASTTVGATGVGEILGIPLEVVNMLIDQHRSGGAKQIRGRSGAKRAKLKARQKPL